MTTKVTIKNQGPKNIEVYTGTLEVGEKTILEPLQEKEAYVHSSAWIEIQEERVKDE